MQKIKHILNGQPQLFALHSDGSTFLTTFYSRWLAKISLIQAFWPGHLLSQFGFGAVVKQSDLLFVCDICSAVQDQGSMTWNAVSHVQWHNESESRYEIHLLHRFFLTQTIICTCWIMSVLYGSIYGEVYTPAICFTGRRNGTGVSVLRRMAWSRVSHPPLSMAHLWC